MTIKAMFIVGALCLSAAAFAGTKSYQVSLTTAVKAGSAKLPAGQYKLTVDGSNAVLTDANKKAYTNAVKVETGDRKYQETAVETEKRDGEEHLKSIKLGGSTTKLEFTE